jgi:uncharacterized membrane protein YkoI
MLRQDPAKILRCWPIPLAWPPVKSHMITSSASVDPMLRRAIFLLAVLMPVLASGQAMARDESDHARARAALAAGQIRPLADILAEVERRYQGRVISTELEQENGRWIYEFRLLPQTGRVFELEMDAATGALLNGKGPVQERR